MVKRRYVKATENELKVDLTSAIVNYLNTKPYRFLDNALTIPECEQLDILLNNDLIFKINFINKYKTRKYYKYTVLHTKENEQIVLKETKNGWLVFDFK